MFYLEIFVQAASVDRQGTVSRSGRRAGSVRSVNRAPSAKARRRMIRWCVVAIAGAITISTVSRPRSVVYQRRTGNVSKDLVCADFFFSSSFRFREFFVFFPLIYGFRVFFFVCVPVIGPQCRQCSHCGKRTAGGGPSCKWHHNYTVCDSCYQQKTKGSVCATCQKAYRFSEQRDMLNCKKYGPNWTFPVPMATTHSHHSQSVDFANENKLPLCRCNSFTHRTCDPSGRHGTAVYECQRCIYMQQHGEESGEWDWKWLPAIVCCSIFVFLLAHCREQCGGFYVDHNENM